MLKNTASFRICIKSLALFLIGSILGLSTGQIPFRYWFFKYDFVKDWLVAFGNFIERNSLSSSTEWFLLGMLITIPFFTLLGVVLGAFFTIFNRAGIRYFLYGFIVNILVYFSLPHIPIESMQILIASAVGAPIFRFSEVIFSNLYFLISFFIATKITLKFGKPNKVKV